MLNQLQFKIIMDNANNSIKNNCKQLAEIDSCKFVLKNITTSQEYENSWLKTK